MLPFCNVILHYCILQDIGVCTYLTGKRGVGLWLLKYAIPQNYSIPACPPTLHNIEYAAIQAAEQDSTRTVSLRVSARNQRPNVNEHLQRQIFNLPFYTTHSLLPTSSPNHARDVSKRLTLSPLPDQNIGQRRLRTAELRSTFAISSKESQFCTNHDRRRLRMGIRRGILKVHVKWVSLIMVNLPRWGVVKEFRISSAHEITYGKFCNSNTQNWNSLPWSYFHHGLRSYLQRRPRTRHDPQRSSRLPYLLQRNHIIHYQIRLQGAPSLINLIKVHPSLHINQTHRRKQSSSKPLKTLITKPSIFQAQLSARVAVFKVMSCLSSGFSTHRSRFRSSRVLRR